MELIRNMNFIACGTSDIGCGLAKAFHNPGNQVIIAGHRKALLDRESRCAKSRHPGSTRT